MSKEAVGFLEVLGYSVALDAMDQACKAVDIKILGIDCNNPTLGDAASIPNVFQVKFVGEVSHVKAALEVARETAGKYISDSDILTHYIAGKEDGIDKLLISSKVKER